MHIKKMEINNKMVDLEGLFKQFQQKDIVIVFDHGRAGNAFFVRVFDQHPEVLSVPFVGYFYSRLVEFFGKKDRVAGEEAYKWMVEGGNIIHIANDMSPKVEKSLRRMGDDPAFQIDRRLIRELLRHLIGDRDTVTLEDIIAGLCLAYVLATKRDIEKVKILLFNDSTKNGRVDGDKRNKRLFNAIEQTNKNFRIIHLVRDPRASFASLRHLYVNQYGTMYPLRVRNIWKATTVSSIWLWILSYTSAGARSIFEWQKKLSNNFYRLKIEDLNLDFVATLEKITAWLGVSWYEPWSRPDYVATAGGLPWRGISSYSSSYQTNIDGPMKNDSQLKPSFAGPNKDIVEKWKKHIYKREIKFLEAVYYDELRRLDYKPLYVHRRIQRFLLLWYVLLPFAGEIPPLRWWVGSKRIRNKIVLLFLLPFGYIFARVMFFAMYLLGKFKLDRKRKFNDEIYTLW